MNNTETKEGRLNEKKHTEYRCNAANGTVK